ncbi:MAG: zf-HC2 domain-containing protein [Terriglobia bacterium]
MHENNLAAFFKSRKTNETSHRGCLDESQIAAYADQQLTGQARERVEAHLADCDVCLAQVAFLIHTQPAGTPELVPPWLLLRAKNLAQKEGRTQGSALWHWGRFAAVAACLVLVAGVMLRRHATMPTFKWHYYPVPLNHNVPRQTSPPTPPAGQIGVPKVRGDQNDPLALTVVFPPAGSTVSENEMDFHWAPVAGALDYELQLMTADGDLVWKQTTTHPSLRLPGKVRLEAGRQYFVLVRVFLTEGKSVESRPVAFTANIRR